MALTVNCARCGHPLPPLSGEEERLFLAGAGTSAQHPAGQCPNELAAAAADTTAPRVRAFEARVQVVEVFPEDERHEVLVDFVAAATAPSAVVAMEAGGALASGLGEKWMRAAEHIGLADVPARPEAGQSGARQALQVEGSR